MRPQKDRALAETLFVCDGKSAAKVAKLLGAGRMTICRWAREGDWVQRRHERRRESPQAALDFLKRQREMLMETVGPKSVANPDVMAALHKLNAAILKMESQPDDIGAMLNGFSRFAKFVAAHADDNSLAVISTWTGKFLDDERRRNS